MTLSATGWACATRAVGLGWLVMAAGSAQEPAKEPDLRSALLPQTPLEAVPRDSVAVFVTLGSQNGADVSSRSAVDLVGFFVDRAQGMGLLSSVDATVRAWIDAIASLPLVFRHDVALVLLDVDARARQDGGHQLAELSGALLLKTDGRNDAVHQRIQHLLNTYTNSDRTELGRAERQGTVVFTMRDQRLPDWFCVEWGALGSLYVVALGDGAFDRIAQAAGRRETRLSEEAWFLAAIQKLGDARTDALLYLQSSAIATVGDAALSNKIARVHDALGMKSVERSLWRFGRRRRAVELTALLHRGKEDERVTIAGALAGDVESAVVPAEADTYTAIQVRPGGLLGAVSQAYLASRSAGAQERIRRFWRQVEEGAGVDIQDDLLRHLCAPILIHDYPDHPLKLPLNITIAAPVCGDAKELRSHLDRLCRTVANMIPEESWLTVKQDTDGIWYLSFGLAGPAVAVTERFLVISYSPRAVRANIETLHAIDEGSLRAFMAGEVETSPGAGGPRSLDQR